MKTKHIKFSLFLFGIGYWKDVYKKPFKGYSHNILLPFTKIQWGKLSYVKFDVIKSFEDKNKYVVTDEFSYIKPHEL